MALFEKKRNPGEMSVSEMTSQDKKSYTAELEGLRSDVIREIEAIMSKVAKDTKRKKLARRRYSLGKSPNDYVG